MPVKSYEQLVEVVKASVGDQVDALIDKGLCEYDSRFYGFLEVYATARDFTPQGWHVVDLGGYIGAQAALFEGICASYTCVDPKPGPRVQLPFVRHFYGTSEEFMLKNPGALYQPDTICICSYNPDRFSQRVCLAFDNHVMVYPGLRSSVQGVHSVV